MEYLSVEKKIENKWIDSEYKDSIKFIIKWLSKEVEFECADNVFIKGMYIENTKGYFHSIPFYEKSAASGNIIGKYYAAWIHEIIENTDDSFKYYLEAASMGHSKCITYLHSKFHFPEWKSNGFIDKILQTKSTHKDFIKFKIKLYKCEFDNMCSDDNKNNNKQLSSESILLMIIDFNTLNRNLYNINEINDIGYLNIPKSKKNELIYIYQSLISNSIDTADLTLFIYFNIKNLIVKFII